jgi:hypothetical protein
MYMSSSYGVFSESWADLCNRRAGLEHLNLNWTQLTHYTQHLEMMSNFGHFPVSITIVGNHITRNVGAV